MIPQRVHMTGIGGAGMSALAEVLLAGGHRVSGTDAEDSATLQRLAQLGAQVSRGHRVEALGDAELLVWSSAISSAHCERRAAAERGIRDMRRGTLLAELMNPRRGVAVAGAHGKTSTTALLGHVLEQCGLDPTVIVGGTLASTGSGARIGRSGLLLAESDESDGSFLELTPALALVTNVDREHLEHYGSWEGLQAAFRRFAGSAREALIFCADDAGASALTDAAVCAVSYGLSAPAQWRAVNLRSEGLGMRFTLLRDAATVGEGTLPLPGAHYVQNAAGVVACAVQLGADPPQALQALAGFRGVQRRFTLLGERDGIRVIDDYGHHPVEITATLRAARAGTTGRIHTVFQPHRYTRTRDLMDAFATAFALSDTLLLLPIYSAGDTPLEGISSETLAAKIARHRSVEVCARHEDAAAKLCASAQRGDLVLCLGAGDVNRIGPMVLRG